MAIVSEVSFRSAEDARCPAQRRRAGKDDEISRQNNGKSGYAPPLFPIKANFTGYAACVNDSERALLKTCSEYEAFSLR